MVTAPTLSQNYSSFVTQGLERYYGRGDFHFITCSCRHRQPLLGTTRSRDLFLTALEQVRRRHQVVVAGYVVMPEHFHLLISEPQKGTPSTVMQALKLGVARRVLSEIRRRDPANSGLMGLRSHFWQPRFYDFNVWNKDKHVEKLRYIHRNPVTRGLVESPELWRCTSYRWYAYGERGPVALREWKHIKLEMKPPV